MAYSEVFKRKMVQKLTGPDAPSAYTLAKEVDVSRSTLERWCKDAASKTGADKMIANRPEDWSPEEKFNIVQEASNLTDDQLGEFLRRTGIYSSHLERWRLQMIQGLNKNNKPTKAKLNSQNNNKIRSLERELRRKEKALA